MNQDEVETVYGARLRDKLPFQNNLAKFVDAALERGETEVNLSLEAKSGFYDSSGSKSVWTIEATADTIGYRETAHSVPSIRDRSIYRKKLERLGEQIEELSDEEIEYEIEPIHHENVSSLY